MIILAKPHLKLEIRKLDYSRIKIENPDDVTTKKPSDNTYEGEENENENGEENEENHDEDEEDFSFLGRQSMIYVIVCM